MIYLRNDPEVTKKAGSSKVAILGLGGLGSNIAVMLARVGVKSLTLIDYDRVELSNLNRQYYTLSDVGEFKTLTLYRGLLSINPNLNLKLLNLKLTEENLGSILKDESLICEAFDGAKEKAMLLEYASTNLDKWFVFGSGMNGYGESNLMKTKKFGKNTYICGDFRAGEFLMAPRVMICAAMQANAVIEIMMRENNNE